MFTINSKAIISFFILLVLCFKLSAQTASNGLTNVSGDIQLGGTLGSNTTIDLGSSYFFKLSKSSQNYLTVLNNGNVGIGVSSPGSKLEISNSTGNWSLFATSTDIDAYGIIGAYGPLTTNVTNGKALAFGVNGEDYARGFFYTDGSLGIGGGSSTRDVFISRSAAGQMKISSDRGTGPGNLIVTGLATGGSTKMVVTDQNGLLSFANIPSGGSTTINNNTASRIITGSNTANTLDAETNLTFGGGHLSVTQSSDAAALSVNAMSVYNSNALNLYVPTNGKAFVIQSTAEPAARLAFYGDGSFGVGSGNASRDVFLSRPSVNTFKISSDRGTGAGNLMVTSLASEGTAPSTVGATKIVITDQNGLLSFSSLPSTQIAYGSTGNAFTSNSNLTFDGTNLLVSGNIGIGTNATSGYRLAVNGDAIFTKLKVKLYNTWPDYVFENNYKLPTLKEVEEFIKVYKHLPGVPSAKEVENSGLDIGNNQALLLKKIEELTLYTIEQNKRLEEEARHNQLLEERLKKLEEKVNH